MTSISNTIAGLQLPDTPLVRDVTDYVRGQENDLLFDHSRRVFFFGTLQGLRRGLQPDLELLYVSHVPRHRLFETYRTSDLR